MKLLLIIAAANLIIFGMTTFIEVMAQISTSLYSAGHDLGTYLKNFFK